MKLSQRISVVMPEPSSSDCEVKRGAVWTVDEDLDLSNWSTGNSSLQTVLDVRN